MMMMMNLRKFSIVFHLIIEGQFKSTRKETVSGISILCASRVEGEGKVKVRVNVVLLVTDLHDDMDEGKRYRKQIHFTKHFQVCDSGHVDEGEEGAAMFDGKSLK